MSTVEITRVEDVRAGDVVTITRNGTTAVGKIRDGEHGDYSHPAIAGLSSRLIAGDDYSWAFVRATREMPAPPDLPTQPRCIVVNASIPGAAVLTVGDDYWSTFASAAREVPDLPDLPTEPGSVIVNATIRGVEGLTAILDPEGDWFTTERIAGHYYHDPEDITAWEPARIVSEED